VWTTDYGIRMTDYGLRMTVERTMPTYLTDLRDQIRKDLHDEDSGSYRWSDTVLNRHIERALAEFSAASPRTATTTINASAGVRDYDLSGITDLVNRPTAVLAVEWPYNASDPAYPPSFVPFRVFANRLYLLAKDAPASGDVIRVWYTLAHILTESTKTLAPEDEPVVALGAAAYAALERESYAAERITPTGRTAEEYHTWGQRALERFQAMLADRRRQAVLAIDGRAVANTSEIRQPVLRSPWPRSLWSDCGVRITGYGVRTTAIRTTGYCR